MNSLRVAIVGAGLMGRWHAYYASQAGATVAAVVDLASDHAAALARKYPGAAVCTDLRECLAGQSIDVVHICTGLGSHVPLAEFALDARKHVLVEKPLAPSEHETARLIESAREKSLRLGVVHQVPFQRGFQTLVKHREQLGELVSIRYETCSAGGENHSPQARRDILLEILPHPFSLIESFLRPAEGDFSWDVLHFSSDDLNLAGRFHDVQLLVTMSLRGRPTRNELCVVGTKSTVHLDLFHGYQIRERRGTSRASKAIGPFASGFQRLGAASWNLFLRAARRQPAYPGLRELVSAFYASILGNAADLFSVTQLLSIARQIDRIRNQVSSGPHPGAE